MKILEWLFVVCLGNEKLAKLRLVRPAVKLSQAFTAFKGFQGLDDSTPPQPLGFAKKRLLFGDTLVWPYEFAKRRLLFGDISVWSLGFAKKWLLLENISVWTLGSTKNRLLFADISVWPLASTKK